MLYFINRTIGDEGGNLMATELERDASLNEYAARLKQKIIYKSAIIGVIGLGYVGLPLAVEKAKVGFQVYGIEQSEKRAAQVNRGENYIGDVKDEELTELTANCKIKAFSSFDVLPECDVIVICVPTPLTITRDPDISYIVNVTEHIAKYLRKGQLITLESTTYPGTTQEVILPMLEAGGFRVGEDFFLAFSPERVDPGNQRFTTKNTSKVVGGVTPSCIDVAYTFYSQTILTVVPVSSPAVAELTKVFENTYRAVNIALVNELMMLCDRMGINVWEVVEAAGTKPFGIQTFYPGPGVGGHCIPIDPFYLAWKAREYDFHTRFIELAGEINIEVSYYVVSKVTEALNRMKKSINGSKILILGVAYKKDIDDVRESPALKIIEQLQRKKARITYHDSYIPKIRSHLEVKLNMYSIDLTPDNISEADCVLILTDHSNVDFEMVVQHAKIVVDTRNATRGIKTRENIVLI